MTKYLKIAPDPDAKPCRCVEGNPDCDHWESCDGCGMDYRKHEGHDCIDGVPVQDLRALAKELRDALASCETERDRLRTEVASLRKITLPDDMRGMLSAHGSDGTILVVGEFSSGREFCEKFRLSAQVAEVPELTDAILDLACGPDISGKADMHSAAFRDLSRMQYRRGWEDLASRLVPTPPQPAPRAVVETQEFRREDRYVVLKRTDLERYATPAQLRELERTCEMVRAGRMTEGKRINSYVVVADNWPEYEETWAKIQARVTGIPQPLQPEERRVGPDEVVVSREEWEALNAFLEDWRAPESRSLHDWNTSLKANAARINALRTSAQDHNGEGAKYKGPSGTTDGGGCMADAFC